MESSLAKGLRRALVAADTEFRRVKRAQRGRLQCKPGCDDCCRRLFQITELEAAELSRAVQRLPDTVRRTIRRKAERYLALREQALKRRGYTESWGALPPSGARLECPLLSDGRCLVYESRPRSCRLYGAPMFHPQMPNRVFACELNFAPGESVADSQLVSIQTELANEWAALQEAYDRAGGRRFDEPVTVAHAVLTDFTDYLPK